MCGGLNCAVGGCHGNSNTLRYSFKVLVLHTRKLSCPTLYISCSAKIKNTEWEIIKYYVKTCALIILWRQSRELRPNRELFLHMCASSVFNAAANLTSLHVNFPLIKQ